MRRLFIVVVFLTAGTAMAQLGTALVTVPASVTFNVRNVNSATIGTPNPAHLSYSSAVLTTGQHIRFSVQADTTTFANPGAGASIPASNVSWTTSNAAGGTGSNGTLSASSYTPVYQSNASVGVSLAGSVDLTFTLAAPGTSIRAGTHTITMRWKIESI